MEELPILGDSFINYVEIFKNSIYYQSGRIDDDPQILNDLCDRLEGFGYDTEFVDAIPEIYWVYHELYDDVFIKLIKNKTLKDVNIFYYFEVDDPKNVSKLHIFEIIKIKRPRRRKTIDELKDDLNEALEKEDYQSAAKLRDKIKLKELKTKKK